MRTKLTKIAISNFYVNELQFMSSPLNCDYYSVVAFIYFCQCLNVERIDDRIEMLERNAPTHNTKRSGKWVILLGRPRSK